MVSGTNFDEKAFLIQMHNFELNFRKMKKVFILLGVISFIGVGCKTGSSASSGSSSNSTSSSTAKTSETKPTTTTTGTPKSVKSIRDAVRPVE